MAPVERQLEPQFINATISYLLAIGDLVRMAEPSGQILVQARRIWYR